MTEKDPKKRDGRLQGERKGPRDELKPLEDFLVPPGSPQSPPPLPSELVCTIRFRPGGAMVDHTNQRSDDEDWYDFASALKTLYYELPPSVQDHIGRRTPAVDAVFRCTRDLFKDRERFTVYARHAIGRLAESAAPVWTIDIDRVQIDQVNKAKETAAPSTATVAERLIDLSKEVLPEDSHAQALRIEQIIKAAQQDLPVDTQQFVDLVNRLLHVLDHRIELADGSQALLTLTPGRKEKAFVQFRLAGKDRGSRGGFRDATITVRPRRP